ncbi:MAG TPA: right-handed parallel beta-helix repeat-containing protein, partial [Saprospiraceae bacterium]
MKNQLFAAFCLCLCLLNQGTLHATSEYPSEDFIIYVDKDATGWEDGSSWADALTNLQDGIEFAFYYGVPVQIWVAAGTYYPDEGFSQVNNSLTSTFLLYNDIAIYGGFAGTETSLEERDWLVNETILSGDINGDGIPNGNAYHVVTGSGTNNSAILDGFTITKGNSNNNGGGVYTISGSPKIRNCYIYNNVAVQYGGGMYNGTASNTVVVNTTFSGNSAYGNNTAQGGGAYNISSSPTFTNCVFLGNWSYYGGGVFNTLSLSPLFTNCSFSGNSSLNGGGAMYNNAGSHADVINCIFWYNSNNGSTTSTSASIFNGGSTCTVSYSLVANSGGSGGGWQSAIGTDGGNNIAVDPLFIMNGDPYDPPLGGNLRLQSGSPALDVAFNDANDEGYDADGNNRVMNDVIDMGAFEFTEGSCDPVTWYADADEDGLGNPNVSTEECDAPIGYVANAADCDDTDPDPCQCAEGGILYVDKDATGNNNGSSWANAFLKLQDALALACTCEVATQIWVANGTYYPDEGTLQTNNSRTSSFQLCNNKAVYGGFNGTETTLSQRNWQTNITILSGDIDQVSSTTNNAYNVVTGSGTDSTALISGFTISGGNANGGGVYPASNNNGAGMHTNAGSPSVEYCTFTGNIAGEDGGGMMNHTNSNPDISHCTFIGNTARYGGGI